MTLSLSSRMIRDEIEVSDSDLVHKLLRDTGMRLYGKHSCLFLISFLHTLTDIE